MANSGFMKNSRYPPNIFRCPSCQKNRTFTICYNTMSSQKEATGTYNKEQLIKGKCEEKTEKELTSPPLDMFPPNKSSMESDMAVESLRNTVFTLTFSLNTNHGYGILGTAAFTEFYTCSTKILELQWIIFSLKQNFIKIIQGLMKHRILEEETYSIQKNLTILHCFQCY